MCVWIILGDSKCIKAIPSDKEIKQLEEVNRSGWTVFNGANQMAVYIQSKWYSLNSADLRKKEERTQN